MKQEQHTPRSGDGYPVGRGYGHDYMRGGEVFGGYGYSEREEYEMPRGLLNKRSEQQADDRDEHNDSA